MDRSRFHARLDPPLMAGLRQLAARSRRSLNAELNLAVQAWIDHAQTQDCANSKSRKAASGDRG